jgi:hypothetical protein
MATLGNENVAKVADFYVCKTCDYLTSKKCNYLKHCSTAKHKKQAFGNILATPGNANPCKSSTVTNSYVCKCHKEFKDRTGLWKHKKKCATFQESKVATPIDNELHRPKRKMRQTHNYYFKQINEWVKENPEANDIQTKKHDQYMKILMKCSGGADLTEDDIFYNKIITNVAKEVQINKSNFL